MNKNVIEGFISEVKESFFCDDDYIRNILELTSSEYEKKYALQNYSFTDAIKLSEYFNININDINNGTVNFTKLKRSFFSPSKSINCEYLKNAGTYMSTIRSMVNHVKTITNQKSSNYLLQKFEIPKEALINDELLVNLSLGNKVLEYIHQEYNFKHVNYLSMAMSSFDTPKRRNLLSLIPKNKSTYQIVSKFIQHISAVEKNFEYNVEKYNDEYIIVKSHSKPEMNEYFQSARICKEPGTLMRKAVFEVVTSLLGKQLIEVEYVKEFTQDNQHFIDYYIRNTGLCRLS